MRLRHNPNAQEILESHMAYYLSDPKQYKGHFNLVFKNENPIHIEIGMGKGSFILEMAKTYPNVNFIGIEKYDSVLVAAIKKIVEEDKIDNLRLMVADAIDLKEIFAENEISELYLNFSDPWPKKRHFKRRLTYKDFLEIYAYLLKDEKHLILKSDHRTFFESSLLSMQQYGMHFIDICLDLHNSEGYENNIQTEYEKKFSKNGPIYRLEANFSLKNNDDNCNK